MRVPQWFILTVGSVSLLLWVTSFIVGIVNPDYHPDPMIGYAAMAVVSACFTGSAIKTITERLAKKVNDEDA